MITATVLQEDYRRHLNRRNTDCETSISIADGDAYINEAIDVVFENFAVKFETNDLLRNHLRQLEVAEYEVPIEKNDKISVKITYPERFYKLTSMYVIGCNKDCKKERRINVHVIQTSDVNKSLKDSYWKPSYQWERSFGHEVGDGFLIYHNCDFEIKKVIINYLKKPNHIQTPSLTVNKYYVKSNGEKVTEDIGLEIDSTFFWRKVTRLAAVNTLLDKGDIQDYQSEMQQLLSIDKIFLT